MCLCPHKEAQSERNLSLCNLWRMAISPGLLTLSTTSHEPAGGERVSPTNLLAALPCSAPDAHCVSCTHDTTSCLVERTLALLCSVHVCLHVRTLAVFPCTRARSPCFHTARAPRRAQACRVFLVHSAHDVAQKSHSRTLTKGGFDSCSASSMAR